jgi:hypothetical protein
VPIGFYSGSASRMILVSSGRETSTNTASQSRQSERRLISSKRVKTVFVKRDIGPTYRLSFPSSELGPPPLHPQGSVAPLSFGSKGETHSLA